MMPASPRSRSGLRFSWPIVVAALLAFQPGCGYRLVGTGGSFPAGVTTVSVATFRNATSQYGLEGETAAAFIRALQSTGKISIADSDQADARLEGTIAAYVNNPISYTAQREVLERRVLVTMEVTFTVRGEEKPFLAEPGMVGRAEYQVSGSVVRDTEREKVAVRRAIEDIASRLVSRLVEGF